MKSFGKLLVAGVLAASSMAHAAGEKGKSEAEVRRATEEAARNAGKDVRGGGPGPAKAASVMANKAVVEALPRLTSEQSARMTDNAATSELYYSALSKLAKIQDPELKRYLGDALANMPKLGPDRTLNEIDSLNEAEVAKYSILAVIAGAAVKADAAGSLAWDAKTKAVVVDMAKFLSEDLRAGTKTPDQMMKDAEAAVQTKHGVRFKRTDLIKRCLFA